jgi:hypothetical protein
VPLGAAVAMGPDGVIYMIGQTPGGFYDGRYVSAYHPDRDSSNGRAPLPMSRWNPAAVPGKDGKIYLLGGYLADPANIAGTTAPTAKVYVYDPAANTWDTTSAPDLPLASAQVVAGVGADGTIYVIEPAASGTGSSCWLYRPGSPGWAASPSPPPGTSPYVGVAVGADGRVYGFTADGHVYSFDPADANPLAPWSTALGLNGFGGPAAVAAGPDGSIYAAGASNYASGGRTGVQVLYLGRHSTATVAAAVIVAGAPISAQPAAVLVNEGATFTGTVATFTTTGKLHAIGGIDAQTNFTNRVYVYRPGDAGWAQGPTRPVPLARAAAILSRDGTLFVLGGITDFGTFNTTVYGHSARSVADAPWAALDTLSDARMYLGVGGGRDGFVYAFGG